MGKPDDVGVGVACVLVAEGKILFMERAGAHASGTWALPGGWIDKSDSDFCYTAAREVAEETGIYVLPEAFTKLDVGTEYHMSEDLRTVTVYMSAQISREQAAQATIKEPDKCKNLVWVDILEGDIPHPLFPGLSKMVPKFLEVL